MSRKLFFPFLVMCSIALTFSCCCDCPGDCQNLSSVTVPIRPQETNNWCWIACAQMVHSYFGHSITQCELANDRLGRTDCCNPEDEGSSCPKTSECNTPGNTKGAIESLNYTVTQANDPLPWNDLRKEIYCKKKPLVFGDGAADGGVGHVRVIYGYVSVGGQNWITLSDPWSPCNGSDDMITYEDYANTTGPGRVHRKTLYKFIDNN